uniref:Phosphoenolpyruvate carboxykinase n=1 Tax=Heterorhabditis bacteriophora TaxID=37862 RepID=A0A1I7WJ49_HETBA
MSATSKNATPQKCGPIHTDEFNALIDSLKPEDTWISEENEHAIIDMFEEFFHCEEGRNTKRGGVLYFFTNLKCQTGCAEVLNLVS